MDNIEKLKIYAMSERLEIYIYKITNFFPTEENIMQFHN